MNEVGRWVLEGEPHERREVQLSSFIICTGQEPKDGQGIQEHLTGCERCRQQVARYHHSLTSQAYINPTGWWDPYRTGPW